jgi:phage protein D
MSAVAGSEELVPSCRIQVNGQPLSADIAADLLTVTVEEDVSAPGMFVFELAEENQGATRVDEDLFSIGRQVVVEMGYVDALDPVIEGEITGLEPEFSSREIPRLRIRGLDLRHRLLRGTRTRTFLKMTDSAIAQKIPARTRSRSGPQTADSRTSTCCNTTRAT